MMPGDLDLAAEIQACLARLLAPHGLTIVHPFPVQLFNSQGCPPEHQLPSFDRSSTLGIVIGNTNALWSRFIQHLASQPESVLSQGNPLDHYVEAAVTQAIHQCSCLAGAEDDALGTSQPVPASSSRSSLQHIVRFSHHTEPGKFVNMLRAAQLSGLAYYSSTTHLCMHPEYGPWFALRAVAVFDTNGPDPSNVSELPCPYPDLEAAAAEQVCRWCCNVPHTAALLLQVCDSVVQQQTWLWRSLDHDCCLPSVSLLELLFATDAAAGGAW